jgi:hypothetical protein
MKNFHLVLAVLNALFFVLGSIVISMEGADLFTVSVMCLNAIAAVVSFQGYERARGREQA